MRISFTKMQGAGNDFVVLDETQQRLNLRPEHYRFLGDRHFGVGADQILSVRAAPSPEFDFEYVIHNNDGSEVEHCGNGARCFVRYVRSKGLTAKRSVRVKTMNHAITLTESEDGRVSVDMGAPFFELSDVPFATQHAHALPTDGSASPEADKNWPKWQLAERKPAETAINSVASSLQILPVSVLSMGNPHAVCVVRDVDDSASSPVHRMGQALQDHPAFPKRVNVGFMQILSRSAIKLRVYERGAGETLACGTGACAAVVAGIRSGLLDQRVDVHTRGGLLTIGWNLAEQGLQAPVILTGPAVMVYEGSVDMPDEGLDARSR